LTGIVNGSEPLVIGTAVVVVLLLGIEVLLGSPVAVVVLLGIEVLLGSPVAVVVLLGIGELVDLALVDTLYVSKRRGLPVEASEERKSI
jgi:hypothetical protein